MKMGFDQDPNEQANISGADLAIMIDELAELKQERDEAVALAEIRGVALTDMNSGWKYIRETHGDLYGVGWDRAQGKADEALSLTGPDALREIQARTLDKAADKAPIQGLSHTALHKMAAAIRKGE